MGPQPAKVTSQMLPQRTKFFILQCFEFIIIKFPNSLFRKHGFSFYLKGNEGGAERETEGERFICWFTPQMPKARPSLTQECGTQYRCPCRGSKPFSHHIHLPVCSLTGSWIRSRGGSWIQIFWLWDVDFPFGNLTIVSDTHPTFQMTSLLCRHLRQLL